MEDPLLMMKVTFEKKNYSGTALFMNNFKIQITFLIKSIEIISKKFYSHIKLISFKGKTMKD